MWYWVQKSIFRQITASFFAAIICATVIILMSSAWIYSKQLYLRSSITSYAFTSLIKELGSPFDTDIAREQNRHFAIDYILETPSGHWKSASELPDLETLLEKKSQHNETLYYASVGFKHFHLEKIDGHWVAYSSPELNVGFSGPYVLIFFIVILTVISMLYLIIRSLLHPLKHIRSYLNQIEQGDFSIRTQVNGENEIADLSLQINDLTSTIEQLLESKRETLLAISHELKTPLARIAIDNQLATNPQQSAIQKQIVDMSELIDCLLEAERLSLKHVDLVKENTDMCRFVAYCLEKDFFLQQEKISLSIPDNSIPVMIDKTRIRLLIKNLIGNALKYGTRATIKISLTPNGVAIRVTDNGNGVSSEDISQLVEPFFRTDKSRRKKTGGHGLGLYLSNKIAHAHDGDMHIENSINEGLIVTVVLPIII